MIHLLPRVVWLTVHRRADRAIVIHAVDLLLSYVLTMGHCYVKP